MSVKRLLDCTPSDLAAYSKTDTYWRPSQAAKAACWPVRPLA